MTGKRNGFGIMASTAYILGILATGAAAQEAKQAPEKTKRQQGNINANFQDPNLDVGNFVERFESESREVFNKREEIVAAIGIEPGMSVADVGAGTGLYTRLFADKVGPTGKVYAVDISPAFLKHIGEQAKKSGQEAIITTVLGDQSSTKLEPRTVDVVFLCDTYHHFEDADKMVRSMRRALKPGGRLVLIDFDRDEDASDFIKGHVRAPKEVFFKEVERAGFEKIEPASQVSLEENFFAVFRKLRLPNTKAVTAPPAAGSSAPVPR